MEKQVTRNADKFARFDKKRTVLLIACLIGAFVVGLGYTWSVVQSPFIEQLGGESVASIVALCYTVTVLASCMSPTLFGAIIRKLGPRKTLLVGTLMFGIGYIASGYITNRVLFFIFFGLGTGIGNGFIYPTIHGIHGQCLPGQTRFYFWCSCGRLRRILHDLVTPIGQLD